MDSKTDLGTLTFVFDTPNLGFNLNPDERLHTVKTFLDEFKRCAATDKYRLEIEYRIISANPGCIKGRVTIAVVLCTIMEFVAQYPDLREGIKLISQDAQAGYEVVIRAANYKFPVSVMTHEFPRFAHEVKTGETLSEIVEGWCIPHQSLDQLLQATF